MELLKLHRRGAHGQQVGGAAGGVGDVQLHRPTVSRECSKAEFQLFVKKWSQYVRSSNYTDDTLLRDQLLCCPDEALERAVYEALDDRADTISVLDQLKEIEVLAVVRQSNKAELSKIPKDTDRGVKVTVEEESRMIILYPEGHSQHNSVQATKHDVEELHTDRMLGEFNTDMVEFNTDMVLGRSLRSCL